MTALNLFFTIAGAAAVARALMFAIQVLDS